MKLDGVNPIPEIQKDWVLENLGIFLKKEMNRKGYEVGFKTPIINTFFTFAHPTISLDKYPVLMIQRTSDSWKRDGTEITSNLQLSYYLDYRNLQKYLGFSYWFSWNMHKTLSAWSLNGGQDSLAEYILYDMDARYYTDEINYRESIAQNREPYIAVWTANITLKR